MSFPKALENNPKIVFFTDFDGTITLRDSNEFLVGNLGFGEQRLRELNRECLEGRANFRDIFQMMMDSIKTPFPECLSLLLENITLDPYFRDFHDWARANNVPIVILSGGMTDVIRSLMEHLLGSAEEAADVAIISNDCVARPGMTREQPGGWNIQFRDESDFGHDKARTIRPYREYLDKKDKEGEKEWHRPTLLYAGDGVSDLSAARETDLLFAKEGMDLVKYCEREKIPFTIFKDWSSILETTKEIHEGKKTVRNVAQEGLDKVQSRDA